MRGFVIVQDKHRAFPDAEIIMPTQQTHSSAGYDFFSNEEATIYPIHYQYKSDAIYEQKHVFWFDIAAIMPPDEVLKVYLRSSLGFKHSLIIPNSVGVIDADYAGNETNGGNIGCCLINLGNTPYTVHKGDRICQGIFEKHWPALFGYNVNNEIRNGGIGSTNK
jgi:dUTP pyrophosphatase